MLPAGLHTAFGAIHVEITIERWDSMAQQINADKYYGLNGCSTLSFFSKRTHNKRNKKNYWSYCVKNHNTSVVMHSGIIVYQFTAYPKSIRALLMIPVRVVPAPGGTRSMKKALPEILRQGFEIGGVSAFCACTSLQRPSPGKKAAARGHTKLTGARRAPGAR